MGILFGLHVKLDLIQGHGDCLKMFLKVSPKARVQAHKYKHVITKSPVAQPIVLYVTCPASEHS